LPSLHDEIAAGGDREARSAAVFEVLTEQDDGLGNQPLLDLDHGPSLGQEPG